VQSYVARTLGSICGLLDGSPEVRAVEAIVAAWARRRGIVYRDDPTAGCDVEPTPAWIEFLHAFDVDFRKRRLVFLIQGQNRLYAKLADDEHGEGRLQIDALKRAFYMSLDRLRRCEHPELYSSITCGELQSLFAVRLEPREMASLDRYAEEFAAANEEAITRLVGRLGAEIDLAAATDELDVLLAGMDVDKWSVHARREVLVNYVGFPFWDVLTLSVTSWRDLGEFDEIRVDRISPEDAPTLARLQDPPALRGTTLMHFGALFSRAFRENDYLLGRLHSIDRIIDIVCDSAGAEAVASIDVAALKRRAFDVVLRAEEAHLPHARKLIERLRAENLGPPGV
jgi:hypothetical protein